MLPEHVAGDLSCAAAVAVDDAAVVQQQDEHNVVVAVAVGVVAVVDASPFVAGVVVVQAEPWLAVAVVPALDSGFAVGAVAGSGTQCTDAVAVLVVVAVVVVPPVVAASAVVDDAVVGVDGTGRNCFAVHDVVVAVVRLVFLVVEALVVAGVLVFAGHILAAVGHGPEELSH